MFKPIGCIEFVVAEELPNVAMQAVGAGFDGGVEDGACGAAQLGAELAGLHLDLRDGVHRRQDDVVGAVEEVDGVGVVVDAVQQVVVLRGAQAVGGEGSGSGIAAGVGLGRLRAGSELGEEGEVASVERHVVDSLLADHLANRRILGLQQRRSGGDLDGFRRGARLELNVDHQVLRDVHHQVLLGGLGKALRGDSDGVVSDSDRREGVETVGVGFSLQGRTLVRVQEGHLRVGNNRAAGILNRTGNRSFVHLTKCVPTWDQEETYGSEGQATKCSNTPADVAIKGHPNILHSLQ